MSDELIAEALIGDEARKFLESDLGVALLKRAQEESEAALMELEDADPTDTKVIMQLQNRVKLGRMFHNYLAELISDGENAIAAFKQEERE